MTVDYTLHPETVYDDVTGARADQVVAKKGGTVVASDGPRIRQMATDLVECGRAAARL